MESRNSEILNNVLEQRKDCIRRRRKEETNETNTLEEVVKSLKKRGADLEKELGERVQVRLQNWSYYFKSSAITIAVYCN